MLIPKQPITELCDALYNDENIPSVVFAFAKPDDAITKDNDIELYTTVDDMGDTVTEWMMMALLPTMEFDGQDVLYMTYLVCPFDSVADHLHDWYDSVNETPVTIRLLYIPKV